MARQIATAFIAAPGAAALQAHCNSIAQMFQQGYVHGDGPDSDVNGVLQAPSGGAPSDLITSATFLNNAKAWWNAHLGYGGAGYAHKVADVANPVATPNMTAGSTLLSTMQTGLIGLIGSSSTVGSLMWSYINHISNTGGAFHTGADLVDILGATSAPVSWDDIALRLNDLKAQFNLHIVNVTGVHGASGAADNITTPNANSTDPDSCLNLANALRTALNAHMARGAAIHPGGADAVNPVTVAALTYPSNIFDLSIAMKTACNAHFPSTTYHYLADSQTISSSNPTTIATLITLAVELYNKLIVHMITNAPKALSLRLV